MGSDQCFAIVICIFLVIAIVLFSMVGMVAIFHPDLRTVDISKSQIVVRTKVVDEFKVYSAVRRYNIK